MQVLPQDVDSQYGIAHSPIGPSPSQSPLAFQPFGSGPSGPRSAYSSALARSASASGSGNLSKLNRSTSGNTANASKGDISDAAAAAAVGVEHHDAAKGTAELSGSPITHEQAIGLPPLSEEGSSVRSAASTSSLTDIAQYETKVAEQPGGFTEAFLLSDSAAHDSATPPSTAQQIPLPEQVASSDATDSGVPQTSPTQQAAAPDESSHQAGTQAAPAQAADESQAATPSEEQLQQSMDAVLRGEDQAMQESMAAANAAGGEQVRDAMPSSSSGLQGKPQEASTAAPEASHTPSDAQDAPLHENEGAVSTSAAASCDDGSDRGSSGASAEAASGQMQSPSEAEAASAQQEEIGSDKLAGSGHTSSSGQIAHRYRWGWYPP